MNTETVRRPSPAPRPICPTCKAYLARRGQAIARALEDQALLEARTLANPRPMIEIAGDFVDGLHRRHTAGLPIGVPA